MNLERMQGMHDRFISNSHNLSGSNDPKQIPNDATEMLIRGAKAAAAGRELGMTDDETIKLLYQNQYRELNSRDY